MTSGYDRLTKAHEKAMAVRAARCKQVFQVGHHALSALVRALGFDPANEDSPVEVFPPTEKPKPGMRYTVAGATEFDANLDGTMVIRVTVGDVVMSDSFTIKRAGPGDDDFIVSLFGAEARTAAASNWPQILAEETITNLETAFAKP
jgi:hypothetical protein